MGTTPPKGIHVPKDTPIVNPEVFGDSWQVLLLRDRTFPVLTEAFPPGHPNHNPPSSLPNLFGVLARRGKGE